MESVDKLRELPVFGAVSVDGDLNATNQRMVCATKEEVLEIADAIESEIAERYLALPLDADGVPIRVGDTVELGESRNQGIVKALNEHMVIAMHVDDGYMNCAKYGLLWNADECHHVTPRTLEDVLADVVTLCANAWKDDKSPFAFYDVSDVMASDNIREYADEIRELLGGDAE